MIRKGTYVRIGKGKKVYEVELAGMVNGEQRFMLDATANHPDAAKRVPDYFRSYRTDELIEVDR